MVMKKLEKKETNYKIDLSTLDGDGTFQCPRCGLAISPDDESEENYQIVDTEVINGELARLLISCRKCGSTILLTGFQPNIDA
jgi:DNA-directed RNA polymerase subunit RPC12/RpoP